MTSKTATATIGSLGATSKMPGKSWGISAELCSVGGKLQGVDNSVCNDCYALKGFYRMPSVKKSHANRIKLFNSSLERDNGDSWVAAMSVLLVDEKYFRFLDSGDLQSVEMLDCFMRVAKRVPGCKFWVPTREYSMVAEWKRQHGEFPSNVTIRLSALMTNGPAPKRVAKDLGVGVSRVTTGEDFNCPASTQDNECGACRACWNEKNTCIVYKKH